MTDGTDVKTSFNAGDICEVDITDIGINGEGIGKVDGFTLFVAGALPGESAKVRLTKVNKNYGFAEVLEFIKTSEKRITPACPYFGNCGGCDTMHLAYNDGLKYKGKAIAQNLNRIGKVFMVGDKPLESINVTPSPKNVRYRNNMQMPVGYDKNGAYIGLYSGKSNTVVPITDCLLADEGLAEVICITESFLNENNITVYDPKTGKGTVRHIAYRSSVTTGEKMVTCIINADDMKNSDVLANKLSKIDGMKSLSLNINKATKGSTFGRITKNIWGQEFITDSIGKYKFRVSTETFLQVNSYLTEAMYKKALEFAEIGKDDTVIDAYCGVGTISVFMAEYAKKVIGIEIASKSIENAKKNATLNGMNNVEFIEGDAPEVVRRLIDDGTRPDVMVVDPPRKGLTAEMIAAVASAGIKKIVYISCDSATLARDIKEFAEYGYRLDKVEAFDMFCWSGHVETVCLLTIA